jgi:hypothetical protein
MARQMREHPWDDAPQASLIEVEDPNSRGRGDEATKCLHSMTSGIFWVPQASRA